MKQFLPFFIFLFGTSLLSAQLCTPDSTLVGNNIYYPPPGSKTYNINGKNLVVLPYAQANQAYSAVIQFKVPADTNIGGLQADIDYIKVMSIQNLSGSLGLSCNPLNCVFQGGSYGCAQISGTAGNADSVQLEVSVEYKFKSNGSQITANDTIRDIYMVTKGGSINIEPAEVNSFNVRLYPNPVKNQGHILFYSHGALPTQVKISNVIGNTVFLKDYISVQGDNKLSLNFGSLSAGVYLYSVRNGANSFSGRFLITK